MAGPHSTNQKEKGIESYKYRFQWFGETARVQVNTKELFFTTATVLLRLILPVFNLSFLGLEKTHIKTPALHTK